ncbi:MAG: LLM class flavin-dependent oxidoreductase [Chloroflexota bacterium]|nr:LLM class flavin-dependent oxidoreductase [Dehalococcoidia bacterium]MDW8253477.1 LLM class flavin-dependent oxidoreductase [Chloroflexota bacterium]
MAQLVIGTPAGGRDTAAAVEDALRKEQHGFSAVWFTGGSGLDPVGLAIATAPRLARARLGTGIATMWAMSPVAMALLGQIAAQLSGGRFRLGIGVASVLGAARFGAAYAKPLAHLREYVTIIKTLVERGEVDFAGRFYRAQARIASPTPMPVMIAALGPAAFELAGEVADGAISWITPASYIREIARPAVERGAQRAGRPAPPIVAHAVVTVSADREAIRDAVRKQFSFYVRLPHYQAMFASAGYPEARDGAWSDAMIDALVIAGGEEAVERGLLDLAAWAKGEVLVSPIAGLEDERTLALLARLAAV